ncbi:MAG: sigma-54-dependent Fis family transcriptional regulator, partial [Deltaproteobacteria bacterium]
FGHVKGAFTGAVREKRGLFELAHRGTIFLDEIGDMSLNMQAKLLRVIEEQAFRRVGGKDLIRVDVRLISATNRNLRRLIEEGRFREDLFYRLDVVTIELPPLRERREDIPLLIEHFLERKRQKMPGKKIEIDPAARRLLLAYDWPGNVRELEHEIERIVVLCDGRVTIEDISPAIRAGTRPVREEDPLAFPLHQPKPLKEIVERYEKRVIEQILEEVAGNKVRAAKLLGIGRRTLYEKLDRYGLK